MKEEDSSIEAVLVPVEGPITAVTLGTFKEAQAAVGGFIECVRFAPGSVAYVDEDGKEKQLATNTRATGFFTQMSLLFPGDRIVGPLLVVGPADTDGNWTSIPANVKEALLSGKPLPWPVI